MNRNTSLPLVAPRSVIATVTCSVNAPAAKLTTWSVRSV
jgi:hypothetical protein